MSQIFLSNGHTVVLKPFVTRKIWKEIQKITFKNVDLVKDSEGKLAQPKFDFDASNESTDFAVASMIESVTGDSIDISTMEKKLDYIQNLSVSDFELLNVPVNALVYPKKDEEEKKV